MIGNPPLLTDSDVDGLAWDFLCSRYAGTIMLTGHLIDASTSSYGGAT